MICHLTTFDNWLEGGNVDRLQYGFAFGNLEVGDVSSLLWGHKPKNSLEHGKKEYHVFSHCMALIVGHIHALVEVFSGPRVA